MNVLGRMVVMVLVAVVAPTIRPLPALGRDGAGPNVIVILCDDLGYGDVGCYGATDIPTPHLDRLAAEGVRFTDFYVPAPVCTPSRAGLITGRHPVRLGLSRVLHPHEARGLSQRETTIAEVLRGAGYATGCFGKWHLGHRPEFLPHLHGFDESLVIPYSHDMYRGAPWAKASWTASWPDFIPLFEGAAEVDRLRGSEDFGGLTRRFTEAACGFIARHASRPFFLYVPQPMPHQEIFPPAPRAGGTARGRYGDVVAEIDASVGMILAQLDAHGIAQRTLVVFTSDNGPAAVYQEGIGAGGSAGPLAGRKASCLEGGVRVPCLARWPDAIPAGSICGEVATVMDLLPTCAALAEAGLPEAEIDGREITSLLRKPEVAASPHEALPYYKDEQLQAVRVGRWKLWLERREQKQDGSVTLHPCRLYDLRDDVGEARDLASERPDVVAELNVAARAVRVPAPDDR